MRLALLLLFLLAGCTRDVPIEQSPGDLGPAVETAGDSEIDFEGQKWKLVGPCESPRWSMRAQCYSAGDANRRVIVMTPYEENALNEGVFSLIIRAQTNQGGKWINHGRFSHWDLNGDHGFKEYVNGKPHGTQYVWYENDQLKLQREYKDGVQHGPARGWYPSGKRQYESVYENDKEISGEFWD